LSPGPGEVGQGGLKVLHLWRNWEKNPPTKQKIFFRVQATRLAASFEPLTGSVALTGPEEFSRNITCVYGRQNC